MSTQAKEHKVLKIFSPTRILIAVGIGLGITSILFYKSLDGRPISSIFSVLSNPNWFWLIMCIIVLFIRDTGYVMRIKGLTSGELSWKGSVYIILLWEFASAVTPSVVGGTAVAIFLLNKEGIKMGKSIAYVMLTAILDNLFFIIAAPIVILTTSQDFLSTEVHMGNWIFPLKVVFFLSYGLISLYTLFMAFGVLINPHMFQSIILAIAQLLRLRQKWKRSLYRMSIDVIVASRELKGKNISYWLTGVTSTIFVWSARYFLLNCLLAAYSDMDFNMHVDAFQKQIILWITQLISVTPGAAGAAEFFMQEIFGKGLLILGITILWRTLTYYAYLIIGSIALPRWLKRVFEKP